MRTLEAAHTVFKFPPTSWDPGLRIRAARPRQFRWATRARGRGRRCTARDTFPPRMRGQPAGLADVYDRPTFALTEWLPPVVACLLLAAKVMGFTQADSTAALLLPVALQFAAVFATVMLVCNGVLGLCLFAGRMRHRVVHFRSVGTVPAVAVLATLATTPTLVLPQFTLSSAGPTYSVPQLYFAGAASLFLYGIFELVQTVRHRDYFLPRGGNEDAHVPPPGAVATADSVVLLTLSLIGVVGLAKVLLPTVEGAVRCAGMPLAVVGIVIAAMVLFPRRSRRCGRHGAAAFRPA